MSVDLILSEQLEQSPAIEQRLVKAMAGVADRICTRPSVQLALNAAERIRPGMVLAGEAAAAELADLMVGINDASKEIERARTDALRIPRAMEQAVNDALKPTLRLLMGARQNASDARVRYQNELRRLAAEAEKKAREAAQEEAKRAAEALAAGEDVPPEAEVAPIEVPRTVSGGTGKMGVMSRITVEGVDDIAKVPHEWLEVCRPVALAAFRSACQAKTVKRPPPGESVVYRGVTFKAVESAVLRR